MSQLFYDEEIKRESSANNALETNAFEMDAEEVDDEVFMKSVANNMQKSSSSSSSSSSSLSPLPNKSLLGNNNLYNRVMSRNINQKMNVSATTTLEISSSNSDSLFNSHFIITPIYSDAVSPFAGLSSGVANISQMLNNTNQNSFS